MQKYIISLLIICFSISFLTSCTQVSSLFKKEDKYLEEKNGKESYVMGFLMTKNIRKITPNIHTKALLKGVEDSLNNTPALNKKEIQAVIRDKLLPQSTKKTKNSKNGEKNMKEGKMFLEKNKERKEVKTTVSGLQYEIIETGSGKQPKSSDTVEVRYRGTLINGTEFDKNDSTSFNLQQVIPGWTEGIQLMKEGAQFKFYIPSSLAYGANGIGQIPPNATLIFEVTLIKVK